MSLQRPTNQVKNARLARGWSQAELAQRAGLSRPGLGAIEAGRLIPSVAAALALAEALECRVEDLFQRKDGATEEEIAWVELPKSDPCRYWTATVHGKRWAYPLEDTSGQSYWHDGTYRHGNFDQVDAAVANSTLVLASCDPAAQLLAREYASTSPFRMIVLRRSSRVALSLLGRKCIHVAGIHLSTRDATDENAQAVRDTIGTGFRLASVAKWEEGIAVSTHVKTNSIQSLLKSDLRWIGREEGSAARACLDDLFAGRTAPRRIARDHRSVAQAIDYGWADAGICLRLTSEEAGLRFLPVRQERYDLCFAKGDEFEPRVAALVALVRSPHYRRRLSQLPGYECRGNGSIRDA